MFLLVLHCRAFCQITFVEGEKSNGGFIKDSTMLPYDSLTNISAIDNSYKHLIGQNVIFYGNSSIEDAWEKYGFGFYSEEVWLKYLKNKDVGRVKIFEKLAYAPFLKKEFKILNIDTINFKRKTYCVVERFMKLQERQSGKIVFYRFDDSFVNSLWTVVGYIEKAKQKYVGNYFMFEKNIYNSKGFLFNSSDFNVVGSTWKCLDISLMASKIADKSIAVLKLSNMDTPADSCYEYLDGLKEKYIVKIFTLADLNNIPKVDRHFQDSIRIEYLKKLYGTDKALDIFNGEVKIGFTTDMCREAWGSPSSRNVTKGSWGVNEQWVYSYRKRYLYFENGILVAIQY